MILWVFSQYMTSQSMEDNIRGEYKSVNIDLFETVLNRKSKMEEHSMIKCIGEIDLTFNKALKGTTIIRKDSGILGNLF